MKKTLRKRLQENTMKKQTKKLALAKETVQSLDSGSLEGVAGGAWSFENSCQFICLSNYTVC